MLKRLAARLPQNVQQYLRRVVNRRRIRQGTFTTDEPEFALLDTWIGPGDWVIDVGANLGVYTRRMSQIVGPTGRVVAIEPIPSTFELLAANTADLGNVTLIQAAAVAKRGAVRMAVPRQESGMANHYRAHLNAEGELSVLGIELADLRIPNPTLVKVDAEGHDFEVLAGMPEGPAARVLIVEHNTPEVAQLLKQRGYKARKLAGSPNVVWTTGRVGGSESRDGIGLQPPDPTE